MVCKKIEVKMILQFFCIVHAMPDFSDLGLYTTQRTLLFFSQNVLVLNEKKQLTILKMI